MKFSTKNISWR